LEIQGDIQQSLMFRTLLHSDSTTEFRPSLDFEWFVQVKERLTPVGRLGIGTGGQGDLFATTWLKWKIILEPADEATELRSLGEFQDKVAVERVKITLFDRQ
jgi:hypothetical protein